MTDAALQTEEAPDQEVAGLYVTDCEIARRLGFARKSGYEVIHRLDRGVAGMRQYPQKDVLFGKRRFWPAVLQWHLDYHRVRRQAEEAAPIQPGWQENFDAAPGKAKRSERARPQLAPT